MTIPYVGITDFTNVEQVRRMIKVLRSHKKPWHFYNLHVGVMMSYKTLNGIETKWSQAFPPKENIAEIFSCFEGVMNCLHYADYDGIDISNNLAKAIDWGGRHLHAIQLDMVWPEPYLILGALEPFGFDNGELLKIILQVGAKAFDMADNSPKKIVERLKSYEFIDYVLLDKSMGRGLGMDCDFLFPHIEAIKNNFPGLGISVAGGLGPDTIGLVEPLVREFPDISIDAQGKLRPSGNALDPIDWDMAEKYIVNSLKILR